MVKYVLEGGKILDRDKLLEYLEERRFKELKEELAYMHPVDIAELMEELEHKQMILVFRLLDKDTAAETFTEMEMRDQIPKSQNSWKKCTLMIQLTF